VKQTITKFDAELHAPQREAAMFYGMFLRGRSLNDLREEIDISPRVLEKLLHCRDLDPDFHDDLRRIYTYRKQVLAIFNSLVTSDQTIHHPQ
jgi:hypothetical protein